MSGIEDRLKKVNRITVVDKEGRSYDKRNISSFSIHFQDDDQTMKIFINENKEVEI